MTAQQRLRGVRPPGAVVVLVDLAGVVQQGLDNSPRLFDAIDSGEKLAIAGQPGMEQALIGHFRFSEIHGERGVQVNVMPRVAEQAG